MDTAGKLLEEIDCESMQKLIVSVSKKIRPTLPFNLPPLDAYLTSLNARRAGDLSPTDMVEIEGHPGSGKSQLLYHILANCIAPECHPPSILDARVKAVVVFDMDAQFDTGRFRDFVVARIRQNFGSVLQLTDIVDRCLKNLCIFKPISTEQLLVTLTRLPKLWRDRQPQSRLTAIAVHSLEAWYWSDRFKIESRTRTTVFPSRDSIYQRVYSCLRSIQEMCEATVVLSHSGLNQVLQHHIPQRTSNHEADIASDNALTTRLNDGSTLFLTTKRVLEEPGLASQPRGACFRISGQASAEQEPIHFDIQITENEGVVIVQQEGRSSH